MSVAAQFLQAVKIGGEPPSKDQLTSAQNTLKGALEKNASLRQQIRQDLTDLGYNAVQVEQNFATVQGVVNELDGREMLQNNEKFGPRWNELHRRYTVTLGDSKASIKNLHNHIHEFVYVLLPMVESDDPGTIKQAIKIRRLDDYIRIIMAFHEPAEKRGNEFLHLKQDVTAFQNNLDTALPNSDNELHNQKNRKVINRNIRGKGNLLESIRQQLDRLEKNEECMHRIMDVLKKHTSWFGETTQKLSGMEGIWRMLANDATALQTRLNVMEKEDDSAMYDLRANSVRPVYEALESALEAYISAL